MTGNKTDESLYMIELYKTLKQSLNEIKRYQNLSVVQLKAFKDYMSVTSKFLPIDNENVRRFFKRMNNWLNTKSAPIKTVEIIEKMRVSDGYIPDTTNWKHCLGSRDYYRGYPCGLWILFHTMTVYEYKNKFKKGNIHMMNNHEVILSMRSYIREFFACKECTDHFTKMSANIENELNRPESSVIWLWKSHNNVNNRLKGVASEDPMHPKVEFPTKTMCQECYQWNGEYDEEVVLDFLLEYYSNFKKNSFINLAIPSQTLISISIIVCITVSGYFSK